MSEFALPEGWSLKRLKYLATYNDDALAESTDEEKEIDYIEISGVSLSRGVEKIESITFGKAPTRARRKVRDGDILISTVRTYLRAITRVEEVSSDLVASTGFCVIRPNSNVDGKFLGWAVQSEPFISEVVARSVGVSYPAINASEIVNINMLLPPLGKQRQIALFLDDKTSRIDALIDKKRVLINLLNEKRQAIITQAVTQGIDTVTSVQHDGLSSKNHLGGVSGMTKFPTRRLRYACKEPLKYGANFSAQYDDREWPRFIRITDITESGQLRDDTFRSLPNEYAVNYLLQEGDILLARSGSIGRSFIYNSGWGNACFAGYLVRLRLCKDFDPKFIYWSLNSACYWSWINSTAIRSTIQNISAERYANYVVPAPSIYTQQRIAQFLNEKTARIDKLKKFLTKSVDKLVEYRSALITAAVTGQLKELQ